jgi:hypothetical protein
VLSEQRVQWLVSLFQKPFPAGNTSGNRQEKQRPDKGLGAWLESLFMRATAVIPIARH